jgi:hypothetical protein
MESARAAFARQILKLLTHDEPVSPSDAFQLRNWAVHPDDAMLSLEEIAYRILTHETGRDAKAVDEQAETG